MQSRRCAHAGVGDVLGPVTVDHCGVAMWVWVMCGLASQFQLCSCRVHAGEGAVVVEVSNV